ncbi:N-terminal acetyltransferase [Geranomyces michiganensis]|nr:N-terminal acetyltransferase [Geranomyces michiganensis]
MSEPAFSPTQFRAYLGRVGLPEEDALPVTLDTIRKLQVAQLQTVPYENLSLHWRPEESIRESLPPCGISLHAVYTKIVSPISGVAATRGGYCLEVNYLLAYALRAVGFAVDCCTARWLVPMGGLGAGAESAEPAACAVDDDDAPVVVPDLSSIWPTHMLLVVSVPGDGQNGRYLVDVGLAKNSLTAPIKLEDGATGCGIAGKQVRLRQIAAEEDKSPQSWIIQFRLPGQKSMWTNAIHFTDTPAELGAVSQIHQWMSRAPESVTPEVPFATMVVRGVGQVSLTGTTLKIRGCSPENPAIADPLRDQQTREVSDVDAALEQYFGIKGYKHGAKLVRVGETPPAW